MKTLSGRFWLVVFGVIVIVAVGSCCCIPCIPGIAYSVEIGNQQRGPYVEWKSEENFNEALAQIRRHKDKRASYCFCVIRNPHDDPKKYKFNDECTDTEYKCPTVDIRTAKVTKSKAADRIAAGQSAANDPNVMHRVQSPDPRDITRVLGALKPVP